MGLSMRIVAMVHGSEDPMGMAAKRPAAVDIVSFQGSDVRVFATDPHNPGWVRREYARKSGEFKGDTYCTYHDPHGQKYTSQKQAQLNGWIAVVS